MKKLFLLLSLMFLLFGCQSAKSTFFQTEVPAPKTAEVQIINNELQAVEVHTEAIKTSVEKIKINLKEIDDLNEHLKPIAGKKIENTGITINWTGLSGILLIVGIIALCIFVPAVIPLLFTLLRKIFSGTLSIIIGAIESMPNDATIKDLKTELNAAMDVKHKKEIVDIQSKLKKDDLS